MSVPRRLLREPDATRAVVRLADRVRGAGLADPDLAQLAAAAWVDADAADRLVSTGDADALVAAGLLVCEPDRVRIRGVLFDAGGIVVHVPEPDDPSDMAYLGPDSMWLLTLAWWHGPRRGHVAVDLGSGTGYLTAALRSRFAAVVATDISARCNAATALTLALNPVRGRVAAPVRTDVAAGLRSGCADLVVANPPYLPEREESRTFAEGGHTGMELPGRFAKEAVRLLRAGGGVAVLLCLDTIWADGRRPLDDLAADLGRVVDVTVERPADDALTRRMGVDTLPERVPGLTSAAHAALVLRN